MNHEVVEFTISATECLKNVLVYTYFATLVVTIYFFHKIYTAQRVHKNLKLVLCLTAITFTTTSTSKQLEELLVNSTQDIDNRLIINCTCIFLSVIHTIACISASLCMNMLTVEQYFATKWVDDYETRSMKVGVILMAVVFFQAVPLGIWSVWYVLHGWYTMKSKTGCLVFDYEPRLSIFCFTTGLVSSSICAVWTYSLYRQNKASSKERSHSKTLSARYQQFENKAWSQSICVSFVMYFFLVASGLTAWIWYFINDRDGSAVETAARMVVEIAYLAADSFSLMHMFGIMYSNRFIRYAILKDLESLGLMSAHSITPEIGRPEDEANEYFSQFARAWN